MDVSSGAFMYESQCSSDSMRITKSQKVYGLSVCPISELKAAVITSEGKVLIWQLQATQVCKCLLKCFLHVNMLWGFGSLFVLLLLNKLHATTMFSA